MIGIWGCSKRSKKVHYYVNGKTLCGRASRLDFKNPTWDESDNQTCESCRHLKRLFSKGMIPADATCSR